MLLEGGPSAVVLEAGPFKYEASCVSYEHTYTDYYQTTMSAISTSSTSTRCGTLRFVRVAVGQPRVITTASTVEKSYNEHAVTWLVHAAGFPHIFSYCRVRAFIVGVIQLFLYTL